MPVIVISLFIITLLSFFISASETAIIGLSRIRLRHMILKGVKRAQSIQRLNAKMDSFITAILVVNNFVNIAMSAMITAICVQAFGFKWGVLIATLASGLLIVTLCEITPKILAIKHTEKVAVFVAPIWDVFVDVSRPVIGFFTVISNFILKIFRIGTGKRSPLITEEELRMMIEIGKEEGVLSDEERKMLHRIFEFGDIKVKDVMVAREKMIAVAANTTSDQLLDIFVEEGHARLPVYEGSKANIIGVIYARDLLYILRDKGLFLLQDLLHKPYFVRGSLRVNELLRTFQKDNVQIAIVVDEHNNALGLVTLEDLLEEIVGEIEEKVHHNGRK
ncbi:MAG: hemolysin family protein [Candidatus Omnitrophota bacterium]